jgi:hypothetical protein
MPCDDPITKGRPTMSYVRTDHAVKVDAGEVTIKLEGNHGTVVVEVLINIKDALMRNPLN